MYHTKSWSMAFRFRQMHFASPLQGIRQVMFLNTVTNIEQLGASPQSPIDTLREIRSLNAKS